MALNASITVKPRYLAVWYKALAQGDYFIVETDKDNSSPDLRQIIDGGAIFCEDGRQCGLVDALEPCLLCHVKIEAEY